MDEIPVMHLMSHSAFIIERNTGQVDGAPVGQWIAFQAMARHKVYQLLPEITETYQQDLLVMIFEDETSIQDFLLDPDPQIAPMQRYARIARSTYGVFVLTADEVLRNMSIGWGKCTAGSGSWVERLLGSTAANEDVPRQSFNATDLDILFGWDWWEIQKFGPSGYLFRVLTEHSDQMMRASLRLPNELPFTEALVDQAFLSTYFSDHTAPPILVVPDDRLQPAMWFEMNHLCDFETFAKVYVHGCSRHGPAICRKEYDMLTAGVPVDVRLAAV